MEGEVVVFHYPHSESDPVEFVRTESSRPNGLLSSTSIGDIALHSNDWALTDLHSKNDLPSELDVYHENLRNHFKNRLRELRYNKMMNLMPGDNVLRSTMLSYITFNKYADISWIERIKAFCHNIFVVSKERLKRDTPKTAKEKLNEYFVTNLQIDSMLSPVFFIMFFMCIYMIMLGIPARDADILIIPSLLPYDKQQGDSFSKEIGGSFLNAALIVGIILSLTAVFLILNIIKYKHAKTIVFYIMAIFNTLSLGFVYGYFFYQAIVLYNIQIDIFTYILFMMNFTAMGWFAIVHIIRSPDNLNRLFLLFLSLAMAWPFTEFNEYSVWATLICLVCWDLFAVLAPCGPLKYAVQQADVLHNNPPPGLMYSGKHFILGLGDFIFYSTIISLSTMKSWETVLTSSLGILVGVVGTIAITLNVKNITAIPALPLSLSLGLLFYFMTDLALLPYMRHIALSHL